MTTISIDLESIEQLGGERKVLLDAIDDLRKHGIGRFVDLPQIIVVGDQSAGKSSVLDAISGVRFPAKAEMCTRFPTEVVLRTHPRFKINVQIQPASASSEPARQFNETSFDTNDLPRIIKNATTQLLQNNATFLEDVLRIEISSPDVPHLTLVDLPGFYHSLDVNQPADGRDIVDRLVGTYMAKKNSIILAIISARSQVVMQKVLLEAKRHDKNQERTLGIITKPDLLIPGSRDEDQFMKLARNQEPQLQLAFGWHVLRNRSEAEASLTPGERDQKEKEFFESGIWSAIPSNNRGVDTLRKKLSNILLDHIRKNIDPLIKEIQDNMTSRQSSLERLGPSRSSPPQLRAHLDKIASQFQLLSLRAIEGNYTHEFFGSLYPDVSSTSMEDSRVRKLRALVREFNQTFAYVLATKGSRRRIVADDSGGNQQDTQQSQAQAVKLPSFLRDLESRYPFSDPENVTRSEVCAELEPLSSANQGTEFPGTTNDLLAVKLFRDQSHPWEAIARCHIELLLRIVKAFTERLMAFITGPDEKTYSAILLNIVDPFLENCTSKLEGKLLELLYHFRNGYPQPSDAEFRAALARHRQKHVNGEVLQHLLTSHPGMFTADGKRQIAELFPTERKREFGAEDLIEKAEAYYELSLRNFTDNITILAIENCLVKDIPSIFTTSMVSQMQDDMLERLAAESAEMQVERAELAAECETLQKGLDLCKTYRGRNSTVLPEILTPSRSESTSQTPLSDSTENTQATNGSHQPGRSPSPAGAAGSGHRPQSVLSGAATSIAIHQKGATSPSLFASLDKSSSNTLTSSTAAPKKSLFGNTTLPVAENSGSVPRPGGLFSSEPGSDSFGSHSTSTWGSGSGSAFGSGSSSPFGSKPTASVFGSKPSSSSESSGLFSIAVKTNPGTNKTGLFGPSTSRATSASTVKDTPASLFGTSATTTSSQYLSTSSSPFGGSPTPSSGGLFSTDKKYKPSS
ncbi:P-loop containing nucleoside triphosphate hydrolase protein [Xylaria arbuscula]|nr:P-loop containing nucleoside triphosphate hydrolase protein [Xylaria arbuscula]